MSSFIASKKDYEVNFFKEGGFERKTCPVCKVPFWTTNPDQKTCGEAPCSTYKFLEGRSWQKRFLTYEMREVFLRFFEKRGHGRVKRYPVVARWRDDLFLTDASIVDFQPFITEGLVPPPANPLCISQPSIRLKDIDKVGLTHGRHLTIFEMMAHHAFNRPDKKIYWKNRTVELHHEFMEKELKVPCELITYKESVWEGGGNAGPCFECIVEGLETATLVFMEYKVLNGKYIKIPMKIVDTGYGLERFLWLMNATPSSFQATYTWLVDKFRQLLGIEKPDDKLLLETAKISGEMGKIELGEGIRKLRSHMARKLGVSISYLEEAIAPVENLYTLLDHTRCLSFMLVDGLIPSNVGEGYLGRLVLRRAIRVLLRTRSDVPLSELIDLQVKYWQREFPEFKEEHQKILEIIELEVSRFMKSLDKGKRLIKKLFKKYSGNVFPLSEAIILYSSHGIPPEVMKEEAERERVKVDLPDNFYEIVASSHYSEKPKLERSIFEPYEKQLKGTPQTELLYYEDPYIDEFKAKVIKKLRVNGENWVVLDKTAFYPEGGGQPSDKGYLKIKNQRIPVLRVQVYREYVLHNIGETWLPIGAIVHGKVDFKKRRRHMAHHTATHILIGAAKRVLGSHIWQAGAQKGEETSRLDISHYKRVSEKDRKKIEKLANKIVMENRPVKSYFMERSTAEQRFGFRIYQGGVVPGKKLRIIEIPGWDVQACAGTHCRTTGEVGPIILLKTENIQDGVERIIFSAGEPAINYMQSLETVLHEISSKLKVPKGQVLPVVLKQIGYLKELSKEKEKTELELFKCKAANLLEKPLKHRSLEIVVDTVTGKDIKYLINYAAVITKMNLETLAFLVNVKQKETEFILLAGEKLVSKGFNCLKVGSLLSKSLSATGGGKIDLYQGAFKGKALGIDKLKEKLIKSIENSGFSL